MEKPAARLSKITDTMIRVPRIQARPWQTSGSLTTRSRFGLPRPMGENLPYRHKFVVVHQHLDQILPGPQVRDWRRWNRPGRPGADAGQLLAVHQQGRLFRQEAAALG